MKKIYYFLTMAIFTLLFASCSEDLPTREPSPEFTGTGGLYFVTSSENYEVTSLEAMTSVDVVVYRVQNNGTATFDIVVNEKDDIFTIPSQITFKDDETTATLTVAISNDVTPFKEHGFTITFKPENISPYTTGVTSTSVTYSELEYSEKKKGVFVDAFVPAFFPKVTIIPFYVDYRMVNYPDNEEFNGLIRIIIDSPFHTIAKRNDDGVILDSYGIADGQNYFSAGNFLSGDYPMEIILEKGEDGKYVGSIPKTSLGFDLGYGEMFGQAVKGVYTADASVVFPAGSAATTDNDGTGATKTPLEFYFSAEAYAVAHPSGD